MSHLGSLGIVALAAVLAFANAPGGALVFDAKVLVGENPILGEASAEAVGFLLTHDYWQPMATDGLYRPVTMLSFLLDRGVLGYGNRATGYVVENVLLHLVCAGLVYALVWTLVRRRWAATVAALLFAVHPVTTEAVTNVVGRADLLATVGVLGGILCWAHGAAPSGRRRMPWGVGLVAASGLALFSKESGLVLLLGIGLHDLAFARRWRLRAEHVVVAVVAAGYLAARAWVDSNGLPPEDLAAIDNPLVEAPFLLGRLTAFGVLARLLGLVVWPATLSVDYSYRQIPIAALPPAQAGDWVAIAGLVGLGLAVWALVRVRRRDPALFFLGAFALAALLPSANLVRLIGSIMAERFLYLPLVGIAGVVAVLLDRGARTPGRRRAATALVGVVALALGVRTSVRNADWRDDRTLWSATVRAVPESAKAQKAWATAYFDPNGSPDDLARVIAAGEQAIALKPDYQQALVDLGGYYVTMGDKLAVRESGAATRWYEKAVVVLETARPLDARVTERFVEKMLARGNPRDRIPDIGDGILYNNLSLAYVKLGRLEDALGAYQRMRQLAPMHAPFYRDIATILGALGRSEEAAVALLQAIDVGDDADAKQRLAELYRGWPAGDAGPIVTEGPGGGVQIHTSHPTVRAHRCRAWRELATIMTDARLFAVADRARAEAKGCDAPA